MTRAIRSGNCKRDQTNISAERTALNDTVKAVTHLPMKPRRDCQRLSAANVVHVPQRHKLLPLAGLASDFGCILCLS